MTSATALASRHELARERLGREEVAASAAAGEHDEAGCRHTSSPVPKRRRVMASTMPMPMPSAISDEPP